MGEANKEEAEKCKQIATNALAAGDADKATRFLQKAKRMCPEDSSIDALLAKAAAGGTGGASPSAGNNSSAAPEGMRHRASASGAPTSSSASGATRTSKDGKQYTPEQMQLVQRILRTKDYYDILEVPKQASEEACKKAYKKLALKLHPDKNHAPGSDEAFKKLSKAVQCLTDAEKKNVYDRYGDEDRMPQQHRQAYQQDFMTPEDLFAAFFGGGGGQQRQHHGEPAEAQRAQILQALPVLILVLLTLASSFASKDNGSRFSFQPNNAYRNERTTASLTVPYYVTDDFEDHYAEGTRALAEFDRQVEVYHVRNLGSDCDYQEKLMYKKVLMAKRRGNQEELQSARNHPRPACKEVERVKKKFPQIYRSAMYMGGY
mmetsp:Transcript_24897/g.45120  ORF Transcript_24897/g.45120 Transcript_24897/m.45120 type:complete len:375 (+) Transcript_24897:46-1170(+)